MGKIYVITAGDYSDYQIYGVTTDPVRAEDMRKKVSCRAGYHGENGKIEEFEDGVFPNGTDWDGIHPMEYWRVDMAPNGNVKRCYSFWEDNNKSMTCSLTNQHYGSTERHTGDLGGILINYIVAPDKEHAMKIAQDERITFLSKLLNI